MSSSEPYSYDRSQHRISAVINVGGRLVREPVIRWSLYQVNSEPFRLPFHSSAQKNLRIACWVAVLDEGKAASHKKRRSLYLPQNNSLPLAVDSSQLSSLYLLLFSQLVNSHRQSFKKDQNWLLTFMEK